jgi:hypothetical protein
MQSAPAPNFSQPPSTQIGPGSSIPSEPPPASGSSDFTRIIQASSLREQALKRGEQPIEAAKPAAPPPAQPQMQMPAFPAAAAPQFPHPSVLPPLNFGHGGMTPQAQPFKPAAPNINPAQWMPPEPPPPTPAAPTQPLLPLILIGIIFVLIVVLVAVVFLLKH